MTWSDEAIEAASLVGNGHDYIRRVLAAAVNVDGPVYRTNFGPTDDGSNDTREAHDAWMEVQDLVRDGWLVEVGEDSTP